VQLAREYLDRRIKQLERSLAEARQARADLDTDDSIVLYRGPLRARGGTVLRLRQAVYDVIARWQPMNLAAVKAALPAERPCEVKAAVRALSEQGVILRIGRTSGALWRLAAQPTAGASESFRVVRATRGQS
jgi:hypothetical protein